MEPEGGGATAAPGIFAAAVRPSAPDRRRPVRRGTAGQRAAGRAVRTGSCRHRLRIRRGADCRGSEQRIAAGSAPDQASDRRGAGAGDRRAAVQQRLRAGGGGGRIIRRSADRAAGPAERAGFARTAHFSIVYYSRSAGTSAGRVRNSGIGDAKSGDPGAAE